MQVFKRILVEASRGEDVTLAGIGKIVAFAYDSGMACIWVEERPGQPERTVRLKVYGFGAEIPDSATHVATAFPLGQTRHLYDITGCAPPEPTEG